MKVTVAQGDVTVESVDLIYDTPDIKILEIHTEQPYPVEGGYTSSYVQYVWPADWEARGDAMLPAKVNFDFDRGSNDWCQVTDADRYHLTVVLFRYHLDHDHRTEIYSNRKDSK